MTPQSLLLPVLVCLFSFITTVSTPMCNNDCCQFVESFPVRLKLREDYSQIRDFYEANNDLDTSLLDQSVEDSFKMESKGLFKAIGELDVLFNYTEMYLASKRQRHRGPSV